MATMLDIRRRIKAVKNIEQVTKAMEMVAAAKLRRAQERVVASRPYAGAMEKMLRRLVEQDRTAGHPLLSARGTENLCVVAVTGDRGLCGSYNVNVLRRLQSVASEWNVRREFVPVGRKARDFMRRRDYPIAWEFFPIGEEPRVSQAREIARFLMRMYEEARFDEIRVIYTEFISPLTQRVKEAILLPVAAPQNRAGLANMEGQRATGAGATEYIFEPSADAVLNSLLPKYVEVQVFQILLESKASEHGARMTAMGNATDNAEEMIEELTLEYNRERQTSITKELSEIVRGAEALKGG